MTYQKGKEGRAKMKCAFCSFRDVAAIEINHKFKADVQKIIT